VIELNLNKKFEGDGRIHYVARIMFPAQGGIDLDSYVMVPQEIINIRRVK